MEAKWSELKAEARVQVCAGCFSMHRGFFFVADVQECGVFGIEQQRGQASTNYLIFSTEDHATILLKVSPHF